MVNEHFPFSVLDQLALGQRIGMTYDDGVFIVGTFEGFYKGIVLINTGKFLVRIPDCEITAIGTPTESACHVDTHHCCFPSYNPVRLAPRTKSKESPWPWQC